MTKRWKKISKIINPALASSPLSTTSTHLLYGSNAFFVISGIPSMKDGNTLLLSLMLAETIENHLSFNLYFLKTKFVNKLICGNLSHDWLDISKTVQWKEKMAKDQIQEKAQLILLKVPVWVLDSPWLVGNLQIPVTGSKCSQLSEHQLFWWLCLWVSHKCVSWWGTELLY